MHKKCTWKRFLSISLSFIMILQLCTFSMDLNVKAANKGYDIVLTKVGYYNQDGTGKLYCDYRTLGNNTVSENFTMKFYVDGKKKGEVTAESNGLKKGETRRAVVTLSGNYSGKYRVTAYADIDDDRTSNNNRTSWRRISESETEPVTQVQTQTEAQTEKQTEAQTEAQVVALSMGTLTVNDDTVTIGDTVRYSVTVSNSGNKNATSVPVTLGDITNNINVSAGGSATATFDVTMSSAGKIDKTASYDFQGQQATSNSVRVNVAPKSVTDLTVAATTTGSVSLSWTAAEGATSYIVKRGNNIIAPSVNGTSYTESGLSQNTQYQYYVIAVNSEIQSQPASIYATTQQEQVVNYTARVVRIGGYDANNITEGDEVTFRTLVQNTTGVAIPAGTPFTINIGIDNSTVQTVNMNQAIPVNGYVYIDQTWTATIGGHTFSASMDGSSVTKRINVAKKINRSYSSTSGADLVVTDIGYYNVTTGVTNGSVSAGDLLQFIAYGANAGSSGIGSGTKIGVQFQIDGSTWGNGGTEWCDNFYGPMSAGSTYDFQSCGGNILTTSGTSVGQNGNTGSCWRATNGSHSVMAWIDDSSLIGESNENNNQTTVSFNFPITVTYNNTVDTPDIVSVVADPIALGNVTNLTDTKATTRRITLTWTAAQGATSYKIYRNNTYVDTTSSTSFTDTGTFTAGQNYTYKVTSCRNSEESTGALRTVTPSDDGVEVQAYPVPEGLKTSPKITMTVEGETVGVFRTRVSETHTWKSNWESGAFSNVAIFDYEGDTAEVKIRAANTNVNSVSVRPVQKGLTASISHEGNDSIITINMPDGKQGAYDVDLNNTAGCEDQVYLFTKKIMDEPANAWRTISSGELATGYIEVPDNQTLYIEGGGRLEGYVHMGNNSKLVGRGVITQVDAGPWQDTNNRNCPLSIGDEPLNKGTTGGPSWGRSYVDVEGISILDSTGWAFNVRNSHHVNIKDVNVMTARSNGDGITIQSSYNVTVDGCFLRTYDDTIVIKNYDNINSHDIKVTDCTLWTDLAQTLEIGWETDMSGTKGRDEAGLLNPEPKIYNVFYKDIYVLHNYHKPVLSIHNGDNVPIYHVAYKNVYIEQKSGAGDGMSGVIDRRIEKHTAESWSTNYDDNSGYIDDIWYYNISNTDTGSSTGSHIHMNEDPGDNFLGW